MPRFGEPPAFEGPGADGDNGNSNIDSRRTQRSAQESRRGASSTSRSTHRGRQPPENQSDPPPYSDVSHADQQPQRNEPGLSSNSGSRALVLRSNTGSTRPDPYEGDEAVARRLQEEENAGAPFQGNFQGRSQGVPRARSSGRARIGGHLGTAGSRSGASYGGGHPRHGEVVRTVTGNYIQWYANRGPLTIPDNRFDDYEDHEVYEDYDEYDEYDDREDGYSWFGPQGRDFGPQPGMHAAMMGSSRVFIACTHGPSIPGGMTAGEHGLFNLTGLPPGFGEEWGTYNGIPQPFGSPLGVAFTFPPPPILGYQIREHVDREGRCWLYLPIVRRRYRTV